MSMRASSRLANRSAHSLLEAMVAAAVFVMVAVAFSGMWAFYAKSAGKANEYVVANHLARSYMEGLAANGYGWLEGQIKAGSSTGEEDVTILRRVRSRSADITYHIKYQLELNTDPDPDNEYTNDRPLPYAPEDVCMIRTAVAWNSGVGDNAPADLAGYSNGVSYVGLVYRNGMH